MREFVRGAAKVSYRQLRVDPWVWFGLAPAVDNLGLRAVLLRTRCRTAAWRLRAQSGHSLRFG
jgi:hypothetical protein